MMLIQIAHGLEEPPTFPCLHHDRDTDTRKVFDTTRSE